MQEVNRFRTQLGGFHRADVANYIEKTAREHQEALAQVKDENARLSAEKAALKAEAEQLKAQLEAALEGREVPAAVDDPESAELAAYRRAEAAERSTNARIRRKTEKLEALMDGLQGEYTAAGEEVTALAGQMQEVFTKLEDSFRKTAADMELIRKENEE